MKQTARTVLPTDLVALVSYDGRVYANQAMTRDRIGTQESPHPLETALEQWLSFATGRHTCVSVKGPTLRGLVSARKRGTRQAWEIDCLIDASDDEEVLLSLLDRITEAAGRSGAMRVFLRLPADSELTAASARAGFTPYLRERVYWRDTRGAGREAPPSLRRRGKTDLYAVFQAYNALVPPEIRRHEGMTFAEWQAAQETLGRMTHYVIEDQRRIGAWVRVAGDGDIGRFDLLADDATLDDAIAAGIAKVSNRERACVITAEYQVALESRLQSLGFERGAEYTVLARRTVLPVKEKKNVRAVVNASFG